jgi:ribosomal protein L37AE/L43A
MSNDRYEKIRKALEMGPTPGQWYWSDAYPTQDGRKTWSLIGDGGVGILSCDGDENSPQSVNFAAAELIAACDSDTIRELLAERDALAAEVERLRDALEETRNRSSNGLNPVGCPHCTQTASADEVKETDLWRCTVCGRVGTVGRCCGEETRERVTMEQLLTENERELKEWIERGRTEDEKAAALKWLEDMRGDSENRAYDQGE